MAVGSTISVLSTCARLILHSMVQLLCSLLPLQPRWLVVLHLSLKTLRSLVRLLLPRVRALTTCPSDFAKTAYVV